MPNEDISYLVPVAAGVAERSLPHNLEMEQALLGAVLVNNDAAARISDFLKPVHFFEPLHGRIFEAAMILVERGQIASPVTVKTFFEKDEALKAVGGAQYLARLTVAAVTVLHAADYGRALYDLALRRQLIAIGEEMSVLAAEPKAGESATEQIEQAESQLFRLAEEGQHEGGFKSFLTSVTAAVHNIEAAYKRDSRLTGVTTGLDALDELLGGLHRSDLLILAGRPSMGKTALATNIAFTAALRSKEDKDAGRAKTESDGAGVAFFSLEMSAEQLATRMLAEAAEVASEKLRRGSLNEHEFRKLATAAQRISEIDFFIDDTPALSIAALRTRARRLKRQHGIGLVVVDYLQLVRPSATRGDNRVQEVSEITQGLKALAKDLDVPVLALSQLSRSVEQREDKRPQLSDLRESGSIEQDADVVMFVFREEYYHERSEPTRDTEKHLKWQEDGERVRGVAEVIIGKQRHGPTGVCRLHFSKETTKFGNLAHRDQFPDHP
jgi:replicative DNA helicase